MDVFAEWFMVAAVMLATAFSVLGLRKPTPPFSEPVPVTTYVAPLLRTANVLLGIAGAATAAWSSIDRPDDATALTPWLGVSVVLCTISSEAYSRRHSRRALSGDPAGRYAQDASVGQRVLGTQTSACILSVLALVRPLDGAPFPVVLPVILVGLAGGLVGSADTIAREPRFVRFLAPRSDEG